MLTAKQKESILKRDNYTCQAPVAHKCNGDQKTLNVHHIMPQRFCTKLGIAYQATNSPCNLISICENFHVGYDGVHPDIAEGKRNFWKRDGSWERVFEERNNKLERCEPYWETSWDRLFFNRATELTKEAYKKGWRFPSKKVRKSQED